MMKFEDIESLGKYIHSRAIKRTKLKLKLARHNKLDTSNETLNDIYYASLKEIKLEVLAGLRNGTIIIEKNKTKTR